MTESLSDVGRDGLGPRLARPGGHVTGVSGFVAERSGRRLDPIREMLSRVDRVRIVQ